MKKSLKLLVIKTLIFTTLIFNFQYNISYGQSYDKIDKLITNQEKEEVLSKRINDLNLILHNENYKNNNILSSSIMSQRNNVNLLKITQLKLWKYFLEKQLSNCKSYEETLIEEVKEERKSVLEENNLSYAKGIWPLENYTYISSKFGYRVHPISKKLSFHTGIDIPAPKNTDVLASDDGIVIFAGNNKGYGNVVKIKHFDNKVTVYAHNYTIIVKEGDIVKKGQVISKVGSTGNSTGNHVHFEVIVNNNRINPIDGVTKDI